MPYALEIDSLTTVKGINQCRHDSRPLCLPTPVNHSCIKCTQNITSACRYIDKALANPSMKLGLLIHATINLCTVSAIIFSYAILRTWRIEVTPWNNGENSIWLSAVFFSWIYWLLAYSSLLPYINVTCIKCHIINQFYIPLIVTFILYWSWQFCIPPQLPVPHSTPCPWNGKNHASTAMNI